MRTHEICTGPILFYDGKFKSYLLRLWRKSYQLFHLFNFYWLIGSNMAIRREVYDKIDGRRNISILEDFDISIKLFKEGTILSRYDKNQVVYTSSRRINRLFVYTLIYAYGHYHYHLTKNYDNLLNYPRFDEMDLRAMLRISERIDRKKVSTLYSNLRSLVARESQEEGIIESSTNE